jgi:hypothetical protein
MAVGDVYRLEAVAIINKNSHVKIKGFLLLSLEVSEVCDSVLAVADKLLLSLLAIILLSIYIRQD